ncbi:MAG: methionine gamma-lyase family protein, partial [Clostridia bacterium]|nr:methionine gamma-lyase family protein [Clostridia bacterium]
MSGTHALAIGFFGLLGPGDRLLCASGPPYDTLHQVIGINGDAPGSLKAMGVAYDQVPLRADDTLDIPATLAALRPDTRVVHIQRSRGYAWRAALTLKDIGNLTQAVRQKRPDVVVMVDNCYGEFVNCQEPTMAGADVIVGSLIKNPGGGIAPTGGYLAGRGEIIERIAQRLTSPGIGGEIGSYAPGYQAFFQGLFLAPHVVAQALKTAMLAASVFDLLGFCVSPTFDAPRSDIIQAIEMGSPERLIAFCRGIQAASPVDSFAVPEPADMPGYQHPVIMAAGSFVSGASIELSADAPLRPPYVVYMQGGLTLAHGRLGLASALGALQKEGLLSD